MPQILQPTGTLQYDAWRDTTSGSTVLHPAVNESYPDDATAIRCPHATIPPDGPWREQRAVFSLPPADTPARRTDHRVYIRLWARPQPEGELLGKRFAVELSDGTAMYRWSGIAPDDPTTFQLDLPAASAADYEDYGTLTIAVERGQVQGGLYVSWVAVEIPHPPFAHLDQSNGGLIVAAPSSGYYLELVGGGALRIAGEETDGALTLGSGGGYVVKL